MSATEAPQKVATTDVFACRSESVWDYFHELGIAIPDPLPNDYIWIGSFDYVQLTYEHVTYDGNTLLMWGEAPFLGQDGVIHDVVGWYKVELVEVGPRTYKTELTGYPFTDVTMSATRDLAPRILIASSMAQMGDDGYLARVYMSDGTVVVPKGATPGTSSHALEEADRTVMTEDGPVVQAPVGSAQFDHDPSLDIRIHHEDRA